MKVGGTLGIEIAANVLKSEGDKKTETNKDGKDNSKTGTKGGERAGKNFTQKGKSKVIEKNKEQNEGKRSVQIVG